MAPQPGARAMTSPTFPVRIRRDYGPPVGRVEAVLDVPEQQRWRFLAWLLDGEARAGIGPETEPRPNETETAHPSSVASAPGETDEPAF
jgi:hypothetical protein